jgi:hypothetical protein
MHAQLIAANDRAKQATRKVVESDFVVERRLTREFVELADRGLTTRTEGTLTVQLAKKDLASLRKACLRESSLSKSSRINTARRTNSRRRLSRVRSACSLQRCRAGFQFVQPVGHCPAGTPRTSITFREANSRASSPVSTDESVIDMSVSLHGRAVS